MLQNSKVNSTSLVASYIYSTDFHVATIATGEKIMHEVVFIHYFESVNVNAYSYIMPKILLA